MQSQAEEKRKALEVNMLRVLSGVLVIFISALAVTTQAQVVVGESIPALQINEPGELMLEGEDTIVYRPWSTDFLVGKVHMVQHLAGRLGVKDMNKPFTDALGARDFSADHFYSTTIINLDDTMFGTSGIVNGQLKGNKIKYWYSSIVADREGDSAKTWRLKPKHSAVIVLSPDSRVLFFKDGQLDENDIANVLALIEQQIEPLQKPPGDEDLAQEVP
jgi:YtfJ family uncharacterized protein